MRTYIALVLAVVVAVLASYSAVQGAMEVARYKRTVSALETQLRASQEAAAKAMRQVSVVSQKSQEAKTSLEESTRANPEWSAGAVPGSVRDSLCGSLRCAGADPMQSPNR